MSQFTEYVEPTWRGLNMRQLKVDEAYLIAKNFYHKVTYLYTLSEQCYTCPYTKVKALHPQQTNDDNITHLTTTLNVAYNMNFKLFDYDAGRYAFSNETALCISEQRHLKEFGVYNFTLNANGTCNWDIDKDGVNIYYSLLSVFLLVALILSILKISLCAWRSYHYEEEVLENVAGSGTTAGTVQQRNRMRSLDVFRGMAIVLMIFVNSGGGDYWWIEHAPWNGLHLADVVFPSFLWIMGVCIPISIKSQLSRGITKAQIAFRILWRSIKLFCIGLCLNSINGPNFENLRIMGVLQRFGIAYLMCGIIHTVFAKKDHLEPQVTWRRALYDLISFKGELMVAFALIVIHLSIVFGLHVPDCPRGYLGPGGKHANASYAGCIGGATGYIDLQILGSSHIYQHPTAKYIYDSKPFDPEGIFGCLLTIVQVLFGALTGVVILMHTDWRARITRWLLWSMFLTIITSILSEFTKESGVIPINKNLWSLSFVCATTALAFTVLSILYYIIDVRHWWTGYPFEACGMNAIIMYVGHTVMHKMLPWHWRIGAMNTHFLLLLEAVWNTLMWIGIAIYLDHINFYYSL
ncbi:heparan-alpha-glucosaminide N-acetyltransferase isoform X1 [Stomoxys calcitrans]|uniref:heparan-alpha-glucosaminide N-acetyltransferase isoform X1 n=2 Tax=Stomoxys calcitrans TaxID=35570 RepID=UPI0027E29B74|nr:heparan-alpha-glucosaminide N-acetyltransferase isoform X1 [Stomoxys calcitrans]